MRLTHQRICAFLVAATVAVAAQRGLGTPLQAFVYMAGNGAGGGQAVALDESNTPLRVGSALQFIWAGTNEEIDPPALNNAPWFTGGDDELQDSEALYNCGEIGQDFLRFGCTHDGEFSGILTGFDTGDSTVGRKSYVRAWNHELVTLATKYGDSELVSVAIGPSDPVEIQQLRTTVDVPVPPELGLTECGWLSTGTPRHDAAGSADFSFRVRDPDGADDVALFTAGSAAYSFDGSSTWTTIPDARVAFYAAHFIPGTNWDGAMYTVTWRAREALGPTNAAVWFRFRVTGKDGDSAPAQGLVTVDTTLPWLEIVETQPLLIAPGQVARVVWHASINGAYRLKLGDTNGITLASGNYIVGTYVTNLVSTTTGLAVGENPLTALIVDEPMPWDTTRVAVDDDTQDIWSVIDPPYEGSVAPRFNAISGRAYAVQTQVIAVFITLCDGTSQLYYNGTEFVSRDPVWLPTTVAPAPRGAVFACDVRSVPWRHGVTYLAQSRAHGTGGIAELPVDVRHFTIDENAAQLSVLRAFPRIIGTGAGRVLWTSDKSGPFFLRANDPDNGTVLASGTVLAGATNATDFVGAQFAMGTNSIWIVSPTGGRAGFWMLRIADLAPFTQRSKTTFTSRSLDTDGDTIEIVYKGHPNSVLTNNGRIISISTVDGKGKVRIRVRMGGAGNGLADLVALWCDGGLAALVGRGVNIGQLDLVDLPFVSAGHGGGGISAVKLTAGSLGECTAYGNIATIMDSLDTATRATYAGTIMLKAGTIQKGVPPAPVDVATHLVIPGMLGALNLGGGNLGTEGYNHYVQATTIKKIGVRGVRYTTFSGTLRTKHLRAGSVFADVLVTAGELKGLGIKDGVLSNRCTYSAAGINRIDVAGKLPNGRIVGGVIAAGYNVSKGTVAQATIGGISAAQGIISLSNNPVVIAAGVVPTQYTNTPAVGLIKKITVRGGTASGDVAAAAKPKVNVLDNQLHFFINGQPE